MLASGTRVQLVGLTSRPDLNGARGLVISFDESKGRHVIKLDKDGQMGLIKPSNVVEEKIGDNLAVASALNPDGTVTATLAWEQPEVMAYKLHIRRKAWLGGEEVVVKEVDGGGSTTSCRVPGLAPGTPHLHLSSCCSSPL